MKRKTYIIGEIGLCHNGRMDIAHELIESAHRANINAVKFQKRTVNLLATKDILDKEDNRFPFLGKTYREIRESLEFTFDQYIELKEHTKELGMDFIITPFDNVALEFITKVGVDAIKLASHSLTNLPFLKLVAQSQEPIIFSTGMSTYQDIDIALDIFKDHKDTGNLTMLHCVSSYPTPDDECQLHFINKLKEKYMVEIGYSGHEIGYFSSLMAVAMGAKVIERHITLDNNMEGFDHIVALNPIDLKKYVDEVEKFERIFGDANMDRDITNVEILTKNKYHVSAISIGLIKRGEIVTEEDIVYKNPGTGIPPKDINVILGKKARFDIPGDTILTKDMFK
ncbi:N-acetylneuraminate synthase family protein [Schleiferiaceae bacterium]|nr:N-acetylneuraminate synthase family protein [Schleiferiaceae bacterium]